MLRERWEGREGEGKGRVGENNESLSGMKGEAEKGGAEAKGEPRNVCRKRGWKRGAGREKQWRVTCVTYLVGGRVIERRIRGV